MTEFVEVKTSELTGAALDWAVAQVEKVKVTVSGTFHEKVFIGCKKGLIKDLYKPSTDWRCGGPLIEAHKVMVVYHNAPDRTPMATTDARHPAFESGETILIAACRAIVASVLGDTVSVPKELLS